MTEHRRTSNEGDPAGNRLNREDFLRRTELLRRIHWKTWMLLVSFAAYGVRPFAVVQFEEIGKDFFPFLLLVSMIFFLENRLNGKCFRCPVCQTPFRPGTAALVIASGRCPACSEEILELPGGGGGMESCGIPRVLPSEVRRTQNRVHCGNSHRRHICSCLVMCFPGNRSRHSVASLAGPDSSRT